MQIGFIDTTLLDRGKPGASGVSDMIWDLAEGLVELGERVHIAGPFLTQQFPVAGVQVHTYSASDFLFRNVLTQSILILKGANCLNKAAKVQIVHTPDYFMAALLTYRFPGIPIIMTTPGNIFERITNFNPYDRVTTQAYKWAARRAARRCAGIIATSQEMAKWWRYAGAPLERIYVIPLAVNAKLFYPRPSAKQRLGWDLNDKHLLYVGRLASENRPEFPLFLLNEVTKQNKKIRLHMIGIGPMNSQLLENATQLGVADQIEWHGSVEFEQLPEYYSAADMLLFTRPTGAPPRIIPQAMACGLPVASVENPNATDYMRDQLHGCFIPFNDISQASEILNHALDSPMRLISWGQAAQSYAREHFSIDQVARSTRSAIYEPALRGKLSHLGRLT